MSASSKTRVALERALVTGASGFVGRHLCAALEKQGTAVVQVTSRTGFDDVDGVAGFAGVEHVFHVAARTGVPAAWLDPVGFLEANTLGTIRILDRCRQQGCGVTFLSAYVYGAPRSLPIAETHPVDANNPYALSKHLAEQACLFFARVFGVKAVVLRLFNVYGPGQDERFLIPFIASQLLDPASSLIEVADLYPRRDYVFIDDVVDAILRSPSAPIGSVLNVGSGDDHSVEDVIRRMSAVARLWKPYVGRADRRPNEIDVTRADVSAIASATGWRPTTTIDEGLARVVQDLRAR